MDLDSLVSVLELYLAPEARSASQTATLEKVHGSKVRLDTTNLVQLRDLMKLESTLQSSDTSDRNLGATSSLSQTSGRPREELAKISFDYSSFFSIK